MQFQRHWVRRGKCCHSYSGGTWECHAASLFLLPLETQMGVYRAGLFEFYSATWQEDCQLPVTPQATSFNKCHLCDPVVNPWQAGWPCQQAGGPTQCLNLALVTWGKWGEPLLYLFRGPPESRRPGSPNRNITPVCVCVCVRDIFKEITRLQECVFL